MVEALTYNDGKLYGVSRDGVFIYDGESFINLISNRSEHSYLESQNSDDCNYFIAEQLNYVPGSKISSSIIFYNNRIYVPNSGIAPNESNNRGGLIIIDTNNEGFIMLNGFIPEALKPIISLLDANLP